MRFGGWRKGFTITKSTVCQTVFFVEIHSRKTVEIS